MLREKHHRRNPSHLPLATPQTTAKAGAKALAIPLILSSNRTTTPFVFNIAGGQCFDGGQQCMMEETIARQE
jgi:hypothetical protein